MTHYCPNHHDSPGSLCGSKPHKARAQNLGVTNLGVTSTNMPIGIDSDDEGSTELCASTSASSLLEGPLEVQLQEHDPGGCDIQTMVVLFPNYIIYGDIYSSESRLTFSRSCIKLDGSTLYGAKAPFSLLWAVTDILNIDAQWCEQLKTATLNLRLKPKDRKVAESPNGSGIIELKFSVFDPQWSKRQEEIKLLDARYNDIWNVAFDIDAARNKDVFLGQNSIFCSKHYFVNELSRNESFEEIIYPKGDPDAVSISKRDIQLLQPETFLNDTIIDFYILYLKNKVKLEERHRFHFFNSFFFRKLADLDKDRSRACESTEAFQRVRKWTRKVNIFEKDYIFIPVNFSLHWSLIVICHPGEVVNNQDKEMENNLSKVPCILHMDSIKGSHRGLRNLIQSYLLEEWRERHNGPEEDTSSKFFNLQFVPLELSKDWFPPGEASSKRTHIKRLINKIVEDNSQKVPRSACDKYSSESEEADGEDTSLELLREIRNSYNESCSDSNADQDIDVTPTAVVPLKSLQYLKKSKLVCDSLLDPGDNAGSLTVWDCRTSGQILPLNCFKNVVSPIEEGEENEEQSAYSPAHEASDKQVAERTEPLAIVTSEEREKGELSSGTSINNGSPISSDTCTNENFGLLGPNREEHNEVYECSSSSSDELAACIVEDSEDENGGDDVIECKNSLRRRRIMVEDSEDENGGDDVIECKSSLHRRRIMVEDSEDENGGNDIIKCKSSLCRRRIMVGDSEAESGGDDLIVCESSPRPIRITASSTPRKVNSIEKIDLIENRMVLVLELEQESAKRPRFMDSEERRRVRRRL
ncbi:hypothetical protein LguiA_027245 [Lonicera macranthoides]